MRFRRGSRALAVIVGNDLTATDIVPALTD
jgi:hypothetical protein